MSDLRIRASYYIQNDLYCNSTDYHATASEVYQQIEEDNMKTYRHG